MAMRLPLPLGATPNPAHVLNQFIRSIPPAAISKPARELTQAEARDLVVYYVHQNQLALEKPIVFGKDGVPTFPKPGDKVKLGLTIAGVQFTPDSKAAASWTHTGPMDLRMAVLAVRLAHFLKAGRWGVTTIYWGGMGVGRDQDDRHGKGFALDFHGAITRHGKFDVWKDWGNQTITLPNLKTARSWPVGTVPHFRLDVDTQAGGFFKDVYDFLTREAADATRPSSIGDRSFIVHPDHPNPALRSSHQDHIHCEIDR